jgi:two-component system, sensor histidine kinase
VLVFTPTGRDAQLLVAALTAAEIDCVSCGSWSAFETELGRGGAALVMAEEVLEPATTMRLSMLLRAQPVWSDLPILLLTARGADSPAVQSASVELGNVTLLERPMRTAALVSAARAAVRARSRQYQSRTQLVLLERTATELGLSDQQLREAHARKDEFLATLAHELRNPLAPIRNALHVMRRMSTDEVMAPVLDIVDRQVRQMVRLVDDLLEVSRITRGKIVLHVERLEIAAILRNAIETSRPLIEAAGHDLIVDLPAEPLYVSGDGVRLGQVFANLLNNAAKYTRDGGVIGVSARVDGGNVKVSVSDTGIGIAPEMLGTVFEMFAQVRATRDRAQGGLGIGLTLVKSLVELHHGRVEAFSAGLERGSRFDVHLKLASAAAVPVDATEGATPAPSFPRVYIVDDNRDAADTLSMVLRAHGAEARAFYSGPDLLANLPAGGRAVVVADLGMPFVSGYELAQQIRANPAFSDVRLVALSGWGQREDRLRAETAGFDAHVTKPADIASLLTLLASFDVR